MADFRSVQTRMWREDEWFGEQELDARLLWIWMQTNENAGQSWQPIKPLVIEQETKIGVHRLYVLFQEFAKAGRIEMPDNQLRFRVLTTEKRCVKCGAGINLTKDHVVPRSWGGTNDADNLQVLCQSCNSAKGNRHDARY